MQHMVQTILFAQTMRLLYHETCATTHHVAVLLCP